MKAAGQFALLKQGRFGPFFVAQLFGVFNDHFFKSALSALITFGIVGLTPAQVSRYNAWLLLVFVVPVVLTASLAGQIAERMEKATLMRWVKLFEIGCMALGLVGFQLQSLPILMTVLALLGLHSAFFMTVKYSIIPQLVSAEELVSGNALIEGVTPFLILLGSVFGHVYAGSVRTGAIAIVISILGYLAARRVQPVPVTAPGLKLEWNPLADTWRNLREVRATPTVILTMVAIGWYWFYGAVLMVQLPNFTKLVIGGNQLVVVLYLFAFAIGTGIGALFCGRWSRHRVEIGLVPLGAIGMTLVGLELYFAAPAQSTVQIAHEQLLGPLQVLHTLRGARVFLDLVLLGFFSGNFIVPLYSNLQARAPASHRARIIAVNNMLSALAGALAAGYSLVLLRHGLTMPQLLLTTAVLNAVIAGGVYALAPEFVTRFVGVIRGRRGDEASDAWTTGD